MNIEQLKAILSELEDLNKTLSLAKRTINKRSRDKEVRKAKEKISYYSKIIPIELIVLFEDKLGYNPLSFQHAEGDIGQCINIITELISEKESNV